MSVKRLLLVAITVFSFQAADCQIYKDACLFIDQYYSDPYTNGYLKSNFKKNKNNEMVLIGGTGSGYETFYRVEPTGQAYALNTIRFYYGGIKDFDIDDNGTIYGCYDNDLVRMTPWDYGESWTKTDYSVSWRRIHGDVNGNVYGLGQHSDGSSYLAKYNSAGVLQWARKTAGSQGLAIKTSATGEVYIIIAAEYGNYRFQKYSTAGTLQLDKELPVSNYNNTGFYFAPEILISPDNFIYLFLPSSNSTELYKIRLSDQAIIGSNSLNDNRLIGAFGPDNILYVLFISSTSVGVSRIEPDVTDVGVNGFSANVDVYGYKSLLFAPDGNTYVAISTTSRFGTRGGVVANFGSYTGTSYYYFDDHIRSAILDSENNVLVSTKETCLTRLIACNTVQTDIISHPTTKTICEGSTTTFYTRVSGRNIRYQWYRSTGIVTDNARIKGANTSTLTITNASIAEDEDYYYCHVEGACGSTAWSYGASLIFIKAPTVSTQPSSVVLCPSNDAVLKITANTTESRNVKYQWKKGTTNLTESSKFVGTTTPTLTIKATSTSEAGDYYCEITGDCHAPVLSQKATVSLLANHAIVNQPSALSVCSGNTATMSIVASGSNVTYQWKRNGSNVSDNATYSGATTPVLTINNVTATQTGNYTCVISSSCGSPTTSQTAALSLTTSPVFSKDPVSQTLCSGATATFTVTSTTTSGFVWKKGNTVISNNTKYSGATTATLTVKNIAAADEGLYTCTLPGQCGNEVVSAPASLAITVAPVISSASADVTACEKEVIRLSVATNAGTFSYQWKKDGVALSDQNTITGSSTAQLYIAGAAGTNSGNYVCEVSSSCGTATSRSINVNVRTAPVFDLQPAPVEACEGEEVRLTVALSTTPSAYQWKKDGTALLNSAGINGVNSPTLVVNEASGSNEGTYWCEVTSPCGALITSEAIQVSIRPAPDLQLQPVIPCDLGPSLDWSNLVTDLRDAFGTYLIYQEGKDPAYDLDDISATGTYFIVKTNGTCSDTVRWDNSCIVTGVEVTSNAVTIYPNPASRTLRVSGLADVSYAEFYDIRGVPVRIEPSRTDQHYELDISALNSGAYMIKLHTRTGISKWQRLIITR